MASTKHNPSEIVYNNYRATLYMNSKGLGSNYWDEASIKILVGFKFFKYMYNLSSAWYHQGVAKLFYQKRVFLKWLYLSLNAALDIIESVTFYYTKF